MKFSSFRLSCAIAVVSLVLVFSISTPGRAGEGDAKKSVSDGKEAKSCFTLLNAAKLPADATPRVRLEAARIDVHWSSKDGMTLQQVITDLGRTISVPVVFMPKAKEVFVAWEQNHFKPNEPFPIDGTVKNIPARGYLDYLLCSINESESAELRWEIREKHILISAELESPWRMQTRIHSIGKLWEADFMPINKWVDTGLFFDDNDFIDLITSTIDPQRWQEVGGPGTISMAEISGNRVLVVLNRQEVQEQIVALLRSLEKMLDSKGKILECVLDETPASCFSRAMQRKVTLDVEEMLLVDFVAELEKQAGESILLDQMSLEVLGLVKTPITYRCKEKPLRWVVDGLSDLTWSSRFGVPELTTKEQTETSLDTSVFDVTDLTICPGLDDFDVDTLIELITSVVDTQSWEEVGGPGTATSICFKKRDRVFLVIRQTESVRENVRQLLAGLRTIRDKKIQYFPKMSKVDQQVVEKLKKRLKWDIKEGTTLSDFLGDLQKRLGLEVRLDKYALECQDIDPHAFTLGPVHVENFSADSLLSLLLAAKDLGWIVWHGELFISTQDELGQKLFTVLYEVSDLIVYTDTQGNRGFDYDSLMELIATTADPESWEEVGGPGTMASMDYGQNRSNVIAIRQTCQVHQEIAQLFANLRAAMPKDPAKRVPPVRSEPLFGPCGPGEGFDSFDALRARLKEDEKKLPEILPGLHRKQGTLVEANNAFAVKLYGQMARQQDEGNPQERAGEGGPRVVRRKSFCFSPYGIASLAQMIKAGTRGNTDRELQQALCLSLSGDELHSAYGSLLTSLMSDNPPGIKMGGNFGCPELFQRVSREFDLAIANRLWIQESSEANILPEFQQLLKWKYLSGVEELDFAGQNSESIRRINEWVSRQTRGRINQIISPGEFSGMDAVTYFVAVNAIYFQGKWVSPFSEAETRPKPFYDSDGKTKLGEVPMMSMSDGTYHVGEIGGVSIFRKPYIGNASFFILLPPPGEGELEKLEASISLTKLRKWVTTPVSQKLDEVEIPKFELESTFPLIDVMKRLGVKELFSVNGADFSGMVPPDSVWAKDPPFVYLMRHKATIKVDEAGTVATGVGGGGVGMGGGMIEPKPQEFIADRPFLFLVFDEKTSSLLFMGRYMGPE